MSDLLKEFQNYWRENSGEMQKKYAYNHAAAQLILQTFLQRVVNGAALVNRELAIGSNRVDLCVTYVGKRYPVEIKIKRPGALKEGLAQLEAYLDICDAHEGWLVIFDKSKNRSWKERITWEDRQLPNRDCIHVVGC